MTPTFATPLPIANQAPSRAALRPILEESAARHDHLCPRQVLGARMGLLGLQLLGLVDAGYEPRFRNHDKRLFTFVETDGCGADGICTAVHCWIVRRTLRVVDIGKMGATFVDTQRDNRAIRVAPHPKARDWIDLFAPHAQSRWHAYLEAYQQMPDDLLLTAQAVDLTVDLQRIISRPGMRAMCEQCGEEIMNEREVERDGQVLCRSCAGIEPYFTSR